VRGVEEARKVVWELIPYTRGKVLDIGEHYKTLPNFIGIGTDIKMDWRKLDIFKDGSCDAVFSSFLINLIYPSELLPILKEWWRVIKRGGYLILYLPNGKDADDKWEVSKGSVLEVMGGIDGWDLVDFQCRTSDGENGLFFVFQKTERGHEESHQKPLPEKKAAVVRYGAQGDMIQASSIFPGLKEQGYHLTLYCQSGLGYEVVKHDPHVDRFVVQDRDLVPPQFLQEYWDYTRKKYDKWVNLSGSVEGMLLAGPESPSWHWPNELRAKMMDRNYIEFTHEIAGVPPPYRPMFYATPKEKEKAKLQARQWGRKSVLWSLAGSSGHKVWPFVDVVIRRILDAYPDVHVVLVGDETCQILEVGWEEEKRVHRRSGVWSIRESMAFAEVADLIIGTETGLLNAAGFLDTPKVINLSHSSEEMLTKHWKNVIPIRQEMEGCPKQPCRQLHGGGGTDAWLDCPKHEGEGVALCQYFISPEQVWQAVVSVLGQARKAA